MMKRILIPVAVLTTVCCSTKQQNDETAFQNGDLLFEVILPDSASERGKAIVSVTEGMEGLQMPHVAIVYVHDDTVSVLEASGTHGVWVTPMDSFLANAPHTKDGKPMVVHARLKDTTWADSAVAHGLTYIGKPYDDYYLPGDSAIYCSELVQLAYKDERGESIFPQEPMSFHDSTGNVTQFWTEYYQKFNHPVPEGWPGTNPGGISRSDKIRVVNRLYE